MKRLIVNADDFGRTPGVVEGTLEAHLKGIVSSATVMILERAAAEGVRQAIERAPRLALGLHIVLTGGGPPASAPTSVPTLAPGGKFVPDAKALPEKLPADEVRREVSAQIAIFEVIAGRSPSHLDSHHHCALHPSVQPVFVEIARQRGLPVRAASSRAREELRREGLRVPDWFLESFYGDGATRDNLHMLIEALPDGTSELMCHPGHPDDELLRTSSYAKERAREIELLCDPEIPTLLDRRGIELVGFDRL